MQQLNEIDRMVMASLCPSGDLFLPLDGVETDTTGGRTGDGTADGAADSLLLLGLGIVSAIFLASLAALA
ncbi:hypothetical protein [Azospirillum sp. B506]|uniref:hypothetical protein n=1 Tax=Azospirillum sp. B506 TaxID=137721 RepID=UPI00034C9FDA|nr:hypothetical protein [Azospirillum sp. B506]